MLAGTVRRGDNDGSDHRMLRRTIRALAAVSLSEAEWIRRVRSTGATLQPRVNADDGYVAGYITQWRDVHSARHGPAITDLEVGGGLSLPELRQGWEADAQTTADAQSEWKFPRSGEPSTREAAHSGYLASWIEALTDAQSFDRTLVRFLPDDRSAWRWAASRVAGVLALWSRRSEAAGHGPFAAAAEEVGMSALGAGSSRRPAILRSPTPDLAQTAFVLAQLCIEVRDPPVESLLAEQLITSIAAIAKAHSDCGEASRAASIDATALNPLRSVCRDMRKATSTSLIGCQLRTGRTSRPQLY
jgi:hypothetical protein